MRLPFPPSIYYLVGRVLDFVLGRGIRVSRINIDINININKKLATIQSKGMLVRCCYSHK